MLVAWLTLMVLAFAQNTSFTLVSRSRNRNNLKYHLIAAFFSNAMWYLTFRNLVTQNMTLALFVPYTIGTMSGSVFGQTISMRIEKLLGATSDGHLEVKKV